MLKRQTRRSLSLSHTVTHNHKNTHSSKTRSLSLSRDSPTSVSGYTFFSYLPATVLPASNHLIRFLVLGFGKKVNEMTTGELLSIEPQELEFPFELKKQISCSMQLTNKTNDHVAFKVKTTNPKKYCVRPNTGIVLPRSTCDVTVTMQAQKESPPDMQCRDKFLLQSAVASSITTPKDITPELFNKESGNQVEECKLKVNYVAPPQPPSPVREGSEEGSSPRASISENEAQDTNDSISVPRAYAESNEKSPETKALIAKLNEEKNSAIQQSKKLHQELEVLRREGNRSSGGIPFTYVVVIGLLGILLGYWVK